MRGDASTIAVINERLRRLSENNRLWPTARHRKIALAITSGARGIGTRRQPSQHDLDCASSSGLNVSRTGASECDRGTVRYLSDLPELLERQSRVCSGEDILDLQRDRIVRDKGGKRWGLSV